MDKAVCFKIVRESFIREFLSLALFLGCLLNAATMAQENITPHPPPGAELFADKSVRTFKIEIVGDEWESLKKDNRRYVRATVRERTNVFTNVAVHLKGMGSFRPLTEKPSFAVRFDKFIPNQTYCGLTKLMLN